MLFVLQFIIEKTCNTDDAAFISLLLNVKKTKVMHKNGSENAQNLNINNTNHEYKKKKLKILVLSKKTLVYVGKILEPEYQWQTKKTTLKLTNFWKDRGIPKELKIKLLRNLIWPVLMYGAEAWTLSKLSQQKCGSTDIL